MRAVTLASLRIEPKLRRYVSVGLAIGLAVGIINLPISMLKGYLQRCAEIAELRLELGRLQERPISLGSRGKSASSMDESPVGIFAATAEAAGNHIQTTLRNLSAELSSGEIHVESVRLLPPLLDGGATAIRASASLIAPGTRIFDVINVLEASDPPIVIDSLRIVSRPDPSAARARGLSSTELTRGEMTLALRVYVQTDKSLSPSSRPAERTASGEKRMP